MHPYIPHLLADIKAAHRKEDAHEEIPTCTSIEEELEEIERWVAGPEPEHTFGYYCGLKSEDFPPAEQLSTQDLQCVCKAFQELLFTWNADISLPEALPLPLKFRFTFDCRARFISPPVGRDSSRRRWQGAALRSW